MGALCELPRPAIRSGGRLMNLALGLFAVFLAGAWMGILVSDRILSQIRSL